MASGQHYNELEDGSFGVFRLREGTEENSEESQDRLLLGRARISICQQIRRKGNSIGRLLEGRTYEQCGTPRICGQLYYVVPREMRRPRC
jgi:hypothetical protein